MIEWLKGRVVRRVSGSCRVILDVQGVGYGVEVATASPELLPGEGEILELHISTVMSESSIRLFGFGDSAGKDMFEVVTGVSGVGPKLGLALLSALGSAGLAAAVLGNDLRSLKAVPGVGAKTAERLVLELRDRVVMFAGSGGSGQVLGGATASGGKISGPEGDVVHALVSMGVKPAIAERAALKAREALGAEAEFQELMREALRHRQ
jgi:Holliday junction DNA helicase RuvA